MTKAQLWEAFLDELDEFLEDQEDVRDGSDGTPLPNRAMQLLTDLRHLRPALPEGYAWVTDGHGGAWQITQSAQPEGTPMDAKRMDDLLTALRAQSFEAMVTADKAGLGPAEAVPVITVENAFWIAATFACPEVVGTTMKSRPKMASYRTTGYSLVDYTGEPPYRCCDGHPPIGYWIEESAERCPVCYLNDLLDAGRSQPQRSE